MSSTKGKQSRGCQHQWLLVNHLTGIYLPYQFCCECNLSVTACGTGTGTVAVMFAHLFGPFFVKASNTLICSCWNVPTLHHKTIRTARYRSLFWSSFIYSFFLTFFSYTVSLTTSWKPTFGTFSGHPLLRRQKSARARQLFSSWFNRLNWRRVCQWWRSFFGLVLQLCARTPLLLMWC